MALKPQLYGSNGTYAASQFVESIVSPYNQISYDDSNTNVTAASTATRRVSMFAQEGDSLDIIVLSNTNFLSNWASIATTPISYTVTETDRIEDTTHARGMQRFVVSNVANGNVTVTATWGTSKPIQGLIVRQIGNTAGPDLTGSANNWQPTPGTGSNTVTSGAPQLSSPNTRFLFLGISQDTAANNSDAVSPGNGWTNDAVFAAAGTLCCRCSHKTVTANNTGDAVHSSATVNEDHLAIISTFVERQPCSMRVYGGNNTVQVGQLIEVAGWTRPQICSNGAFITPKFVEG